MDIVITVHGVESLGEWQRQIHPELTGLADLRHYPHTYGPYRDLHTLSESERTRAETDFFARYSYVREQHPAVPPSIIAHSFGAYLVARALKRFPFMELDAVVLCGSIVDPEYDWSTRRVDRIRNEIAGDDAVVKLFRVGSLRRRIPDSGPSGLVGFTRSPGKVLQQTFEQYRHSDHFISNEHCRVNWIPFIRQSTLFKALCQRCWPLPEDPEAQRQFDELYAAEIAHWTALLFAAASPDSQLLVRRLIRRRIIYEGMTGRHRAYRLIPDVAVETYRECRDSGVAR